MSIENNDRLYTIHAGHEIIQELRNRNTPIGILLEEEVYTKYTGINMFFNYNKYFTKYESFGFYLIDRSITIYERYDFVLTKRGVLISV